MPGKTYGVDRRIAGLQDMRSKGDGWFGGPSDPLCSVSAISRPFNCILRRLRWLEFGFAAPLPFWWTR